ncbi:hypothetical protein DFP73DRAFT_236866 [Morchella snyderi]|nr:hypothetical protein DFP73DRAFT_236866 [Morchella snyderi]
MAKKTRSTARSTSGVTAAFSPAPVSSLPPSGRGRGRGRGHAARATRPAQGGRSPSSARNSSSSNSAPFTSSVDLATPNSVIPSVKAADAPTPRATGDGTLTSVASPLSPLPPFVTKAAPSVTPSTITEAAAVSSSSSLCPLSSLLAGPSRGFDRATPKIPRSVRSALKRSKDRPSSTRISKTVRFISKATAEFSPAKFGEDNDSPEIEHHSKPDGFRYRETQSATGYQMGGTRRLVFNYESEVTGNQGALHHQALFKVGLGGGRVKPGKGTLAKRTQVILYMKEDLNLQGIPENMGMVFHKIAADNFMPVIVVEGDPAAISAPISSAGRRFDPEDPDA